MALVVQYLPAVRTLLLAILLTGCWPEEDIVLLDERFEGDWGARWLVSGGVTQVETVHPGERGVIFDNETWMDVPLAATIYDTFSDGLWIEYTSTCGGAPLVTLTPEGATYRIRLDLPAAPSDLREDGAFELVHLSLPPTLVDDPWGSEPDVTIDRLRVAVGYTSSDCILDNLRLMQPAVDYAY